MRKLTDIFSIKPCNPNKLVRENREKINELIDYIESLERGIRNADN